MAKRKKKHHMKKMSKKGTKHLRRGAKGIGKRGSSKRGARRSHRL